jgi:hypothetical protein
VSSPHTFDLASFSAACPALAATDPDQLAATFGTATVILTKWDGCLLAGERLQMALNLLTGHLTQTAKLLAAGQASVAPITGATQGSVSVSMLPPPATSGWQYWLSTTPYGIELWAVLSMAGAGGFLIGGSLERKSFRKAGGIF